MFRHVVQVDKYIIQIYYDTDIQKIRENVIHKLLESYRSIMLWFSDLRADQRKKSYIRINTRELNRELYT